MTSVDDQGLLIWDIFPESRANEIGTPRDVSIDSMSNSIIPPSVAETWRCSFVNQLMSISVHPEMSKNLLVADSKGSTYLVDWEACRTLKPRNDEAILMEFIEPRSLSQLLFDRKHSYTGSVAWKSDDSNTWVL